MPSRFWRNRPPLPFSMSDSDLSGRLLGPDSGRPRRPLSNSASTASCNIRFSLRTMMSGAPSSMSRFSRLLRLMTRRYRSFRSDVAKRPPSSGTSGRRSGGMTGMTSRIISSGRLPDCRKALTTFSRLAIFLRLASLPVSIISIRRSRASSSRSKSCINSRTASAPMPTRKLPGPNSSSAFRYRSSPSSSFGLNGVSPGSMTMYDSKYSTRSRSLSVMSMSVPRRLGRLLRNQMWATGLASSM